MTLLVLLFDSKFGQNGNSIRYLINERPLSRISSDTRRALSHSKYRFESFFNNCISFYSFQVRRESISELFFPLLFDVIECNIADTGEY